MSGINKCGVGAAAKTATALAWLFLLASEARADGLELALPIDCEIGHTCAIQNYVDHGSPPSAKDYRCGSLTYRGHNGTDFRLPTLATQIAGVNVLATAVGQVLRTRANMPDRLLSPENAPSVANQECGNGLLVAHGDGWETQYCHLAQNSVRVKAGDRVAAGQSLGQVGLSGQTEFPHLHLTVRHRGQVIDPFAFGAAPGSCGGGTFLWSARTRHSLAYRERSILNVGFAKGPISMAQVETGEMNHNVPGPGADAIVAFVRAIGLKAGDVQQLSLRAPDGQIIVDHSEKPLDRDKAQNLLFAGKKRSSLAWPAGRYQANYTIRRNNRIELEKTFELAL